MKKNEMVWGVGATRHPEKTIVSIYEFMIIDCFANGEYTVENIVGNQLSLSESDIYKNRDEAVKGAIKQLQEVIEMNDYKEGDNVWWLAKNNIPGCFSICIQECKVKRMEESTFFVLENGVGSITTVPPDMVHPNKKAALNASIRIFQEQLFNE